MKHCTCTSADVFDRMEMEMFWVIVTFGSFTVMYVRLYCRSNLLRKSQPNTGLLIFSTFLRLESNR